MSKRLWSTSEQSLMPPLSLQCLPQLRLQHHYLCSLLLILIHGSSTRTSQIENWGIQRVDTSRECPDVHHPKMWVLPLMGTFLQANLEIHDTALTLNIYIHHRTKRDSFYWFFHYTWTCSRKHIQTIENISNISQTNIIKPSDHFRKCIILNVVSAGEKTHLLIHHYSSSRCSSHPGTKSPHLGGGKRLDLRSPSWERQQMVLQTFGMTHWFNDIKCHHDFGLNLQRFKCHHALLSMCRSCKGSIWLRQLCASGCLGCFHTEVASCEPKTSR